MNISILKKTPRTKRWMMVDQSFLSLFITFTLIELTNRGSGIIDGLFVSNFLDTASIASVGIAKSIYSLMGIVSGLRSWSYACGITAPCSMSSGILRSRSTLVMTKTIWISD